MGAAAKTALQTAAALSVAEEYAQLTGEEIFVASQETSRAYNGQVLAKAVVIVQTRIHCSSLSELGRRIGISRSVVHRHAAARPISNPLFLRAMRDLAILMDEGHSA